MWNVSKIVCATPQCIENDLVTGRIKLKDVSLCIFDEAHRAVGDYAYVFIAKQFARHNSNGLTLALTASPGHEREKIQDVCRNLFVKNIEIKTHNDEDVKPYTNKIDVEWQVIDLPKDFLTISVLFKKFMQSQVVSLKEMGLTPSGSLNYFSRKRLLDLQSSIRKKISSNKASPSLYAAASKTAALIKISHALALLETQGIPSLNGYLNRLEKKSVTGSKADKAIMKSESVLKAISLTRELFEAGEKHPKLFALQNILEQQFKQNPESKIIVFNHYRDSVKDIVRELEKNSLIQPKEFVGQSMKQNSRGMTQKEQVKAIQDFEKGVYNVLVATSVAEEGLNIPACDLVVFYEPVPSEIRHIQRRGRTGRLNEGRAIILMAKNTRDEGFYYAAKNKEKNMISSLKEIKKSGALKDGLNRAKQTTLHQHRSDLSDTIMIYADTREQQSKVIKLLKEKNAEIHVKQMEVGDFVLTDQIVIERKTVEDFLTSMLDGRLFNQLVNMATNYEQPLMILEGNPRELFSLRNVHANAIIGALTSIALNYRVPILFTEDEEETAQFIYVTAKREQLGKEKDIRLRVGRPSLSESQLQQFIVESLPMVGPLTAKTLLNHFGSIHNLFNASEKDLKEVEKMGPKKAKAIRKIIEKKFE